VQQARRVGIPSDFWRFLQRSWQAACAEQRKKQQARLAKAGAGAAGGGGAEVWEVPPGGQQQQQGGWGERGMNTGAAYAAAMIFLDAC
jgi:hypothetical protein